MTKMVPHFLKLINETLGVVDGDKALLRKRNELQGQLCAALQVRPRPLQPPASCRTAVGSVSRLFWVCAAVCVGVGNNGAARARGPLLCEQRPWRTLRACGSFS